MNKTTSITCSADILKVYLNESIIIDVDMPTYTGQNCQRLVENQKDKFIFIHYLTCNFVKMVKMAAH